MFPGNSRFAPAAAGCGGTALTNNPMPSPPGVMNLVRLVFMGNVFKPRTRPAPWSPFDMDAGEFQMRPKSGIGSVGRPTVIGAVSGFLRQEDVWVLSNMRGKAPFGPGVGGTYTPVPFDQQYWNQQKATG